MSGIVEVYGGQEKAQNLEQQSNIENGGLLGLVLLRFSPVKHRHARSVSLARSRSGVTAVIPSRHSVGQARALAVPDLQFAQSLAVLPFRRLTSATV